MNQHTVSTARQTPQIAAPLNFTSFLCALSQPSATESTLHPSPPPFLLPSAHSHCPLRFENYSWHRWLSGFLASWTAAAARAAGCQIFHTECGHSLHNSDSTHVSMGGRVKRRRRRTWRSRKSVRWNWISRKHKRARSHAYLLSGQQQQVRSKAGRLACGTNRADTQTHTDAHGQSRNERPSMVCT